ncbi:MAG: hypothetical protein KatS3mg090_0315 [Patescibacteria group bacterium]|nr:MAG: hypothetical protein KatS3mg090_0315 [Patescibacteria group bacterium]
MKRIKVNNSEKDLLKIQPEVIKTLENNGLVVYPSDTVYGFLASAKSTEAVLKLINVKRRPFGKPISVFLPSFESINDYVYTNTKQLKLLKQLLPGPFTIVLDSKHQVSHYLESEKGSLGIRLPDYKPVVNLALGFGSAITATSANISGKGPHYTIDSFIKTLSQKRLDQIDLIVDVGKLPFNKPSTVLDLTEDSIKVLRKGDVLLEEVGRFKSESPKQTRKIAEFLYKNYFAKVKSSSVFVFLEGDLGAGKTEFTKGVGKAVGVSEVVSPSFVGFYEYQLSNPDKFHNLIHFDLYNINDRSELDYFNIESFAKGRNLVIIEWGQKIKGLIDKLKQSATVFYIQIIYENKNTRLIKLNQ